MYSYDPKTKQQSLQSKHLHHLGPRKLAKVCCMEKVIILNQMVLYNMHMLQNGIVNQNIYLEILTHRCDAIHNKDQKITAWCTANSSPQHMPVHSAPLAQHY